MCGIIAYVGNKSNAGKILFEGLHTLEYRGYDSSRKNILERLIF